MSILDKKYLSLIDPVKRQSEIIFSSEIKFSAVHLEIESETILPSAFFNNNNQIIIVKGAPERLLPLCQSYYDEDGEKHALSEEMLNRITDTVNNLSHTGIRVIAFTTSDENQLESETKELPQSLSLVGCFGLRDEIRDTSKEAIQLAINAGIQVIMITGDRKETAISIAKEVGLLEDNNYDKRVLTSDDLKRLDKSEIQKMIPDLRVIARALPSDKSRLVKICKKLNLVVGMTGDGVNDAAALKNADVGFAMGSGAEMAREAADIVIMNDNFESITKAVLYGRTIFKSIRKFIIFQSTINVASTLIVFLGPFLRIDFPLTLIQLLWVNLVMDTLAALAFGGEPALKAYMKQKPIPRETAIISPYMWSSILIGGASIACVSIFLLLSTFVRTFFVRNGVASEEVFFFRVFWILYIYYDD
jgi:calcium-translocating P-type ATPase